jgi:hypothetical protein
MIAGRWIAVSALALSACQKPAQLQPPDISVRPGNPDSDQLVVRVKNNSNEDICLPRAEIGLVDQMFFDKGVTTSDPAHSFGGVDKTEGFVIVLAGRSNTFGGVWPRSFKGKLTFHFASCRALFASPAHLWSYVEVPFEK